MVSALGYERTEPGFESRRPESDFSSRHKKKNGGNTSSTLAATSTVPSNN